MLPVNVRRLIKPVNAAKPAGQVYAPPTARQNIHPVRTAVTQVLRTGVRCTGHAMATVAEMGVFHLVIRGAAVRDALLQAVEAPVEGVLPAEEAAPAVVLKGLGAAVLGGEAPRHPSVHGKSGASFSQIMGVGRGHPVHTAQQGNIAGIKARSCIVYMKLPVKRSMSAGIGSHIMPVIRAMQRKANVMRIPAVGMIWRTKQAAAIQVQDATMTVRLTASPGSPLHMNKAGIISGFIWEKYKNCRPDRFVLFGHYFPVYFFDKIN